MLLVGYVPIIIGTTNLLCNALIVNMLHQDVRLVIKYRVNALNAKIINLYLGVEIKVSVLVVRFMIHSAAHVILVDVLVV